MNCPDEKYMMEAILLAKKAESLGEVPVGAVVVCGGVIIGRGYNLRESEKNALRHAEIDAIDSACRALGSFRLSGCTLYVTLEPCPMCAGAVINSRICRVVFGAKDPKAGAFGSVINLAAYPLNHKPDIVGGVLENDCASLLSRFFEKLRK